MSDMDRIRAGRLIEAAGFDALVLFQPEAFRYAVGAAAGVATMWGRAGSAIALVPADPNRPICAVASDHASAAIRRQAPAVELRSHRIWIDMVDLTGVTDMAGIDPAYRRQGLGGARPETFDLSVCFQLLGDLLREQGLAAGRIGVDLEFMPAADFALLKSSISDITWLDGSKTFGRIRMVKTKPEILRLQQAALAAEAGLIALSEAARPGVSLPMLSQAWKDGAQAAAHAGGFRLSGHWDFISVGADLTDQSAVVAPGSLIKADVGTLVDGYSSDGARTFVWGAAAPLAQDIFKALEKAFAAGLEQIRPGNTFGSVHSAVLGSMRRDGFAEYDRGHFGHSVGGGVGIEEWPFFSASNGEMIEKDMVVALEAPFYAQGIGALMIEDQFLVTDDGAVAMTTLDRGLIQLQG